MDFESYFTYIREKPTEWYLAVTVSVVAGLTVFWISHDLFPYHSSNHDEGVYLQHAEMLLDGKLFMKPGSLADSFRPWFFIVEGSAEDARIYPKYSPVASSFFAIGKLLGGYRVALAIIASANSFLVYAIASKAFDRLTGLISSLLLLLSPLFLIQSSLFLPYAPTTLLNLLFAYTYICSIEKSNVRYAGVAGISIGISFFSRPYTAILFAAPFILHALYSIEHKRRHSTSKIFREEFRRQAVTATLGLVFVGVTLGYNKLMTGSFTVFPYLEFAPMDGIGFGRRKILGYERLYDVSTAIESNTYTLYYLVTRWTTAGVLGIGVFFLGVAFHSRSLLEKSGLQKYVSALNEKIRSNLHEEGEEGERLEDDEGEKPGIGEEGAGYGFDDDTVKLLLLGTLISVIVGNIYFWGNLNILGDLTNPGDGLISLYGPYYHFDLLLPISAFMGAGLVGVHRHIRSYSKEFEISESRTVEIVVAVAIVSSTVFGLGVYSTLTPKFEDNAEVTEAYEVAYDPFEEHNLSKSLVFLPTPQGEWLNHPFQYLRNDPDLDGETLYALDLGSKNFDVADSYSNYSLYRYSYRGEWAPYDGKTVLPKLERVRVVKGERIKMETDIGVPADVSSVSLMVETPSDSRQFVYNSSVIWNITVESTVTSRGINVGGKFKPLKGSSTVRHDGEGEVKIVVFLSRDYVSSITYRQELAFETENQKVRVITPPDTEACFTSTGCRGETTYLKNITVPGTYLKTQVNATNPSRDK